MPLVKMQVNLRFINVRVHVLLLLSTLQKSDLLSHKRKLLYEGRIKWMSAHGKAFGLHNVVYINGKKIIASISSVYHGAIKATTARYLTPQLQAQ